MANAASATPTPESASTPGAERAAARLVGQKPSLLSRIRTFLRPPRKLKFTREGRYFFFIALAIGFAAVNTGNNLLYLLLGMTLSLIVASGVLSEQVLRGLTVRRDLPPELYAERPFLVGVELANGKKRVASYSVEVEDLTDGHLLDKKCYFLKVPPARAQHTSYRFAFGKRGRHRFEAVRLSTKFPFGLFRKSRDMPLVDEVVVYPAVVDVSDLVRGARIGSGEAPTGRAGRGDDFYGMRSYRDGEDHRVIHWKTSARAGRLMVRETEQASTRRVALYLDNACPEPADPSHVEDVERAIARTASLAAHFIDRGFRVRVVTRDTQVPEGAGRPHLRQILRALALLDVLFGERPEPLRVSPNLPAILVTPGRHRTPPPPEPT